MAIRKSFYYDPIRQGYDTNSWRTITGAPAISGSRLSLDNAAGIGAAIIHYVDFVKGEIVFDINIPTVPTAGTSREFGVSSPNTSAYILFSLGESLTCKTSDGTTATTSSEITWESAWTSANVSFKIRWEPGGAKFFINNVQVYAVSDASVPYGPLSLYLTDDAESSMTVGDIVVKATQSFVSNLKTTDTSVTSSTGKLSLGQSVTVAENISLLIPELFLPFTPGEMFQNVSVSENLQIEAPLLPVITDTITVSENNGFYILVKLITDDIPETVTVSEDIVLLIPELFIPFSTEEMYDGVTVDENVEMLKSEQDIATEEIAQSVTVSEDISLTIV